MPTITLAVDRIWITLAEAPDGDAVVAGSNQTTAGQFPLDGAIDHFAGGRVQASVFDQDDAVYSYTLRLLSPEMLQRLILWRGRTVLLRTFEGVHDYVVFYNVPWRRVLHLSFTGNYGFDVDLALQRVSYG